MAAAPSSKQDKGVSGPRSENTDPEPLGQKGPDTWGDRGGEGHGGGSDRRQQRENLLGSEGPSDAPILRKGNY